MCHCSRLKYHSLLVEIKFVIIETWIINSKTNVWVMLFHRPLLRVWTNINWHIQLKILVWTRLRQKQDDPISDLSNATSMWLFYSCVSLSVKHRFVKGNESVWPLLDMKQMHLCDIAVDLCGWPISGNLWVWCKRSAYGQSNLNYTKSLSLVDPFCLPHVLGQYQNSPSLYKSIPSHLRIIRLHAVCS